jgi:enoyl-CoA hydratase/carnithine racemase
LADALADPQPGAGLVGPEGGGAIVVELRGALPPTAQRQLPTLAAVLVGVGDQAHRVADVFDVVVADPTEVLAAIDANPVASTALAMLLRSSAALDIHDALVCESATYSLLQAGAEHHAWLAAQPARTAHVDAEPVRVARDGDVLRLTLSRPDVRNAFNAAMREALLDGLAIASADRSIGRVLLDGEGPAFCSGGDLAEFGTLVDPAAAHLLRVGRNVGRAIHGLRDRMTVYVHGSCVGAGVELPPFARRITAHPDTTFRLPEVGMGLVPGAGGTVSIPRRVGRHRAMLLALTGSAIDARTALDWGLIDTIRDQGE